MATATVTISYTRDFQIQLDDSLTPEQIQKEGYNNAFNFMAELLEQQQKSYTILAILNNL